MIKVGIAGVGGIGSNVALNLVRSGVKHFKIFDFDRIEKSNLNRQFYFEDQIGKYKVDMLEINLKRIDSSVTIEKQVLKLDENNIVEALNDCDVIVEGFDDKICKKILIEAFGNSDKLVVSASGIAGYKLDEMSVRKIGRCYIVGDFQTDFEAAKVYSPKVVIAASTMSNIVLEKSGFFE
ncbi:MAG: sulfur carrier protein ThiS adenylyltransferase ThiF [Candidatus Cloacimonetes bacterium]|nr:sulfur carrier protein ThiS adenylyltransferase ThiF [Candidatus Cloacimonadota bacterium]